MIWMTLLACGTVKPVPGMASPSVSVQVTVDSGLPPGPGPGSVPEPSGVEVVGPATLVLGDTVGICAAHTLMFVPGAYTCGVARVHVAEGPEGPTVFGIELIAAAEVAGLTPRRRDVFVVHYLAGVDPQTAIPEASSSLERPGATPRLYGQHVLENSLGEKVLYLSQSP